MDEEHEALVIDIGTAHLKAGFCFDDAPKHMVPMVLGKAKNKSLLVGLDQKDWFIGEEALEKQSLLELHHPVKGGYINGREGLDHIREIIENLLTHDMLINQEEYKFMVTEPPKNPREVREEFVQDM